MLSKIQNLLYGFRHENRDTIAYWQLKKQLAGIPRFTPGRVVVPGWDLQYVDAQALLSCFDVIVVKRWNDFSSEKSDPLILDCGANIGISVLHYKRLFPHARITAFEPDHAICEVLRRNLSISHARDVTVVEAAVWTEAGMHPFLVEGADGSRLCTSLPSTSGYMVKTVRLADYLAAEPVDFVKMDIEGAESDVILDCARQLHHVRSMIIEFHLMNNRSEKLVTTLGVLAKAGFSVAINSYGAWVDLVHKTTPRPPGSLESDQYALVAAWRDN